MSTFRDSSRRDWDSGFTTEHINAGSLQRIADAVEKVAGSYSAIIEERDRYKQWYADRGKAISRLHHSNAALRGYIKRLKTWKLK